MSRKETRYVTIAGNATAAQELDLVAGTNVTLTPVVAGRKTTLTIAASGGGGGTTDHAALTSNLAWGTSGHTGTASRLAGFGGGGATAYYQIGVDVQAYDADLATMASLAGSRGAIMVRDSGGNWSILSLGASGHVLQSNGTDLIFGTVGGGMMGSILTTEEDMMIRRGGSATRLPVGANEMVLKVVGGLVTWAPAAAMVMACNEAGIVIDWIQESLRAT